MVGRREFAGQLAIAVYGLTRLALILTGRQFTSTGRKLYR